MQTALNRFNNEDMIFFSFCHCSFRMMDIVLCLYFLSFCDGWARLTWNCICLRVTYNLWLLATCQVNYEEYVLLFWTEDETLRTVSFHLWERKLNLRKQVFISCLCLECTQYCGSSLIAVSGLCFLAQSIWRDFLFILK